MKKISFLVLALTASLFSRSLEDIKNSGEIRVGLNPDLPPFSVLKDGNFTGFEAYLAENIGKDIVGKDGKVTFIPISPTSAISYLDDEKVDMVLDNFAITEDSKSKVDFSNPYLISDLRFIVRKDKKINKFAQLKNSTVLFTPGTEGDMYIQENKAKFDGMNFIPCYSTQECYDRLESDEAVAWADSIFTIANIILKDDRYIIPDDHIAEHTYMAVAVKKENNDLVKAINESITRLSKENFFSKEYDETFAPYYKDVIDKEHFLVDSVYRVFG